jgi:hypothetical protein
MTVVKLESIGEISRIQVMLAQGRDAPLGLISLNK